MNSSTTSSTTSASELKEKPPVRAATLASLCRKIIAKNLERYPPASFGSLAEAEWDAVIRLKYKMTAPRILASHSATSLSGGRKNPAVNDKVMTQIEGSNPHLSTSNVTDELVWKDCTNHRFKRGGPSRPPLLELPWPLQVKKVKKIAAELQLIFTEPVGNDVSADETEQQRTLRLKSLVQALMNTPMNVPLLSETGVGKTVKKCIKDCKKREEHGVPEWYPDVHCASHPYAIANSSLLSSMKKLLEGWKQMAGATGAGACTSRGRNTSEDQHLQDYNSAQNCASWRSLFGILLQREQNIIKTKGAKMRKIRDDLESDRPKMKGTATKQKKMGNRRLGNKLLYGESPTRTPAYNQGSKGSVSKLNRLKYETNANRARIAGKSPAGRSSAFSSAVASSVGQKRKPTSIPMTNGKKDPRVFGLDGGMTMKLPKTKKRR